MAKRKPLLDAAAQAFIRGEGTAAVAAKPEPLKVAPAAAPPPAPGATVRFTLDMDPEQHRRLRVAAANRGVRMSVIVREALDQWLSNG